MKKLLGFVLCISMVMVVFAGCSMDKKIDEAINAPENANGTYSVQQEDAETTGEESEAIESGNETGYTEITMTDEIKNQAEAEGVEAEELLGIIKEMAENEARSKGISTEEYLYLIKENGSTPLQSILEVTNQLDMSIVEYYEMLNGVQTSAVDGKLSEADLPSGYPAADLPILDLIEIRVISENDTYIEVSYFSSMSYTELVETYDVLLIDTADYRKKDYGTAATIKGTISEMSVKIEIAEVDDEGRQVNITLTK